MTINSMPGGEEYKGISPEIAAANARARMEMKGVVPAKEVVEQRQTERLTELDEEISPLREKLNAETIDPTEKLILEGLLDERGKIASKLNKPN